MIKSLQDLIAYHLYLFILEALELKYFIIGPELMIVFGVRPLGRQPTWATPDLGDNMHITLVSNLIENS